MSQDNAASAAYKKAIKRTRDEEYLKKNFPPWMQFFAMKLPDKDVADTQLNIIETTQHRKERELRDSPHAYENYGWLAYEHFTSQSWFEAFIMCNIMLIGIATGVDLENEGDPGVEKFVSSVSFVTLVVFTFECGVKLLAEGYKPERYFTDSENGAFNTFDFGIVFLSWAFVGNSSGSAIGFLRMLRLVRLLTFIKGVPQLRVIVLGLLEGFKSVTYILMLLFLVIYLFAIIGVIFLGANDPARFGHVGLAMLSLFQVSTLASWTSIAYTTWYGCEIYTGSSYSDDQPYMYHTKLGSFQGFHCLTSESNPFFTFVYFQVFLVLSSWVIMSLFIGVISMGMFEAFEKMKRDNKMKQYLAKLEANQANSKKSNKDKQKKKKEAQAAKMKQGTQGTTSLSSSPPASSSGTPRKGGGNPRRAPTKTIDGVEAKEELPDHKHGLLNSMDNMVESVSEDWGDMMESAGEVLEEAANDVEEFMDMLQGAKKTSLKEKIDYALEDVHPWNPPAETFYGRIFQDSVTWCRATSQSTWFTTMVTATIVLVAVWIGVETDQFLHCERFKVHEINRLEKGVDPQAQHWCNGGALPASVAMEIIGQLVFTFECGVKITAEGVYPMRYFKDPEAGSWNCLDFFVVCIGFIEMTPARIIFEAFHVVVLRLLRLLRIFRLAKALPRLRAIVEALISGFSAVGWVVILLMVFNYITACSMMLFFKNTDPFHYGSLGRAMFTGLRVQTLDTTDQIMNLGLFGCGVFPAYDFTADLPDSVGRHIRCEDSMAFGWFFVPVMLFVIVCGSYILPVVLVGIVSISFNEATYRAEQLQEMYSGMQEVIDKARKELPDFFDPERMQAIRAVFDEMDADGLMVLDVHEMNLFYRYCFQSLFDVELSADEVTGLFHLMDLDGSAELGFSEFVMFVVVLKQIELKCRNDRKYAKKLFTNGMGAYHALVQEVEAATLEHNAEAKHRASMVATHRSSFAQHGSMASSAKKSGSGAPPSPPSSQEHRHNNTSSSMTSGGNDSGGRGRGSPENMQLAQDVRQFGVGGGTGGSSRSGGSGGSGRSKGQHVSFTEGLVDIEGSGEGPRRGFGHSATRAGSAAGSKAAGGKAAAHRPVSTSMSRTPAEVKLAAALRDHRNRAWDKVVKRINDNATEEAWDKVIAYLGKGSQELAAKEKMRLLFEAFDSDGGGNLDVQELTEGLQTFDIYLTKQQVKALMPDTDVDGDGAVSFEEFIAQIEEVRRAREMKIFYDQNLSSHAGIGQAAANEDRAKEFASRKFVPQSLDELLDFQCRRALRAFLKDEGDLRGQPEEDALAAILVHKIKPQIEAAIQGNVNYTNDRNGTHNNHDDNEGNSRGGSAHKEGQSSTATTTSSSSSQPWQPSQRNVTPPLGVRESSDGVPLGAYPEDDHDASNNYYHRSAQNHTGGNRSNHGRALPPPPPGGYLEGLRTSDEIAAVRNRNSHSPLQPVLFPNERMAAGAPGYFAAAPPQMPPPSRRMPPDHPPPPHHHREGGGDDVMHYELPPPGIQEEGELPGRQQPPPSAPRRQFNSPQSNSHANSHANSHQGVLSPARPEGRFATMRSPHEESDLLLPPRPAPLPPPMPRSQAPPQVGRGASSSSSGYAYGRYNDVRLEPKSKSDRIDQELQAAQKKFELRQAQLRDEQFEAELAQSQAQRKDHGERSYGAFTT